MLTPTRTPEGFPSRCPVCEHDVVIEPTYLFGDATCPRCGSLLWFIQFGEKSLVYERQTSEELKHRFINRIAELFGTDRERVTPDILDWLNELGNDSLDVVNLVMALEEEFDIDGDNIGDLLT